MKIRIIDLGSGDEERIRAIGAMLVDGFRENAPGAYPDLATAIAEVRDWFIADRVSRVAIDDDSGEAVGWIGGTRNYSGHAWELHPLVVRPDRQLRGIGRALVKDLEQHVAARGGITIYLGADDETNQTSLAGIDLYPDVWTHVRNIRNLRRHQYEFYQKLGYAIVGIIPDANGFGKPDIFMAKRVGGTARQN